MRYDRSNCKNSAAAAVRSRDMEWQSRCGIILITRKAKGVIAPPGAVYGNVPAMQQSVEPSGTEAFDEKQFYLDEFRGRTLLFCSSVEELAREEDYERLAAMARDLLLNDTRVLLLVGVPDATRSEQVLRRMQRRLGPLIFREETIPLFPQPRDRTGAFMQLDPDAFAAAQTGATALLAAVWTVLRRGPLFVGIITGADRITATHLAQFVGSRLRVHKLVLLEAEGGLTSADGNQLSFVDGATLATLLGVGEAEWAGFANRRATFNAIQSALRGGVGSVNLCSVEGAARELFTYEGSGTLFTLADYCTVQRLGIDDFEEVERLIARGQREGVLKVRTPDEIAALLMNGYGATIGAHHLAGVCALLIEPYAADAAGEIVGLYTITRFKGEGVASRLVSRILEDARAAKLRYLFASTTEERAKVFFERQGFRRISADAVPAAKWDSYDPARKAVVAVFRFDLPPPGAA